MRRESLQLADIDFSSTKSSPILTGEVVRLADYNKCNIHGEVAAKEIHRVLALHRVEVG